MALSNQNIKAGFQATRLILFSLERVLTSLTVVRTLSLLATTINRGVL
jgi:hypothetical protein